MEVAVFKEIMLYDSFQWLVEKDNVIWYLIVDYYTFNVAVDFFVYVILFLINMEFIMQIEGDYFVVVDIVNVFLVFCCMLKIRVNLFL